MLTRRIDDIKESVEELLDSTDEGAHYREKRDALIELREFINNELDTYVNVY